MIIYSSLYELANGKATEAKTYANYSELLEAVKPDLMGNGHYYDISVHSEKELSEMPDDRPPLGQEELFRGWELDQDMRDLYGYNQIKQHTRDLIPKDWKKIRFVVGWHHEMHIRSGEYNHVWNEKLWSVVGIVACDWPGKETTTTKEKTNE